MARYQAVRGTFDVLPQEMPPWHALENVSRDLAQRFGYREIRTPLFEEADLFTRGMGVMSGLIEKELWTFKDKYGQKLALRTDATTGIIRSYQQNKLFNAKLPLKVFYLAPVFLLGKEGEERSRQSHQFGFEAIGSSNPALDAEVITLAAAFCEALGLDDYSIRLNSLGGKECRPVYLQKLKEYFGSNIGQLCSTCKRKYKANPDWVLSCEEEGCKSLSQVAPTIFGHLTNDAKSDFSQLREYLKEMELPVELDPRVVRDSEYYNGSVFEIRCQDKSIGFGGRYDSLVEKLGGKATPAVGFAFCLESVLELLDKGDHQEPNQDVLLRPEGPESAKLLVPLLYTLRQRGVTAELDYSYSNGRRRRESISGYSYLVTLDESNAFRGNAILRDLEESSDEKVPVSRLRNRVLHVAGVSSEEEKDGSQSGRKRLRRGRRKSEDEKKKDSPQNERSESRSKRNRSRGKRGRDTDKEEIVDNTPKEESKDSGSGGESSKRGRRRRSERDSEDKDKSRSSKSKERRSRKETKAPESDGGKAIVPVFGLGGPSLGGGGEAPRKASASKKRTPKPAAASAGGGLNWSILPDKEGD